MDLALDNQQRLICHKTNQTLPILDLGLKMVINIYEITCIKMFYLVLTCISLLKSNISNIFMKFLAIFWFLFDIFGEDSVFKMNNVLFTAFCDKNI